MSQKFDELKKQIQNVDKDKVGQVIKDVKQAHQDGQIDKSERDELMNTAKKGFGDVDLSSFGGGLGGFGKK